MGKIDICIRLKGGRVGKKEMYKKVIMADFIEELSELPMETQEAVLKNLSEKMIPVEIEGSVFMVHEEVSKLIDNLVMQIRELKVEKASWRNRE